jgi:carbamoyltransferase
MNVLGITGGRREDIAAAVISGGRLTAAVEQRKLPGVSAIRECLRLAKLSPGDVAVIAVARPVDEGTLRGWRAIFADSQVRLVDHHTAHAASAYFASGFSEAHVLTMDTGNDLVSAQWSRSPDLAPVRQMLYPDSVGDLYSGVTELLGLERRADEHKLQWMSAEGDNRFVETFEAILGEPWQAMERRFQPALYRALDLPEGAPVPESLRVHVAAGIQRAVERYVVRLAPEGGNLCLAGGVFFNAPLIRALESAGKWERVFVQPAAGNSGTAIGAAYLAADGDRQPMDTLALGPEFSAEEIKQVIENCKLRFRYLAGPDEIHAAAISLLRDNKILAWMQGRMEFGPRALGHRSILASPLDPYSSENLNVYIKHRERFRKFAAAIPAERCAEYFDAGPNARFLATIGRVHAAHRQTFEAALMGGEWIRVHAVEREDNPLFHRLLTRFGEATGLPVLYNTSFNLFGDPLVATPRDAVRSFYSSGIDAMIAGNFMLEK